jgi:hypothetical protein
MLLPNLLLRFDTPTFFAHAASSSWNTSVSYSHCFLGARSVAMTILSPIGSWRLCAIYTDVTETLTFVALRKGWTLLASTLMTILERVIRLNVCDILQRAWDTRKKVYSWSHYWNFRRGALDILYFALIASKLNSCRTRPLFSDEDFKIKMSNNCP